MSSVRTDFGLIDAGQAAHGMGAMSGERMERAIKHTYVCGTDEWFAEEVCVLCWAWGRPETRQSSTCFLRV